MDILMDIMMVSAGECWLITMVRSDHCEKVLLNCGCGLGVMMVMNLLFLLRGLMMVNTGWQW